MPAGLRQLVTLACGFGSSFTLPVVFFSSMLPAAAAERALGYTALILLSWSPLLWSLGPVLVKPSGSGASSGASLDGGSVAAAAPAAPAPLAPGSGATAAQLRRFARQVATPPFLAVMCGALAGLTPLGRALVSPSSDAAAQMLGPIGGGVLVRVEGGAAGACCACWPPRFQPP